MSAPDMAPSPLTVYAKRQSDENFCVCSLRIPSGMETDELVVFVGASLPLRDLVHLLHLLGDHLDLGLADGPADRFEFEHDNSEPWNGGAA